MAAERTAEHALNLARAVEQPLEVDPSRVAHLVQHRDEVLARDVAGRPLGHRAAAELGAAGSGQPLGDRQHALGIDLALVGTAERDRDDRLAAQALAERAGDDLLEPGQRLLYRAVDVRAAVALRRGQEEVDLAERLAQLERVVEAALVRDQDRDGHLVGDVGAAQHLRSVGELWDDVGADEARHLEALQARAREHLDQPHLVVGRDGLGLILEAVARADLADADRIVSHGYIMPRPPETPTVSPVTYDASSLARKAIAAATSSGWPRRRISVESIIPWTNRSPSSPSASAARTICVSIGPGATALTRTP